MKFAVGEIVVIVRTVKPQWRHLVGTEAVVTHLPRAMSWIDPKDMRSVKPDRYVVDCLEGSFQFEEASLRKRPPPPNWEKLSDPRSLPIEDKVLELA